MSDKLKFPNSLIDRFASTYSLFIHLSIFCLSVYLFTYSYVHFSIHTYILLTSGGAFFVCEVFFKCFSPFSSEDVPPGAANHTKQMGVSTVH